MTTFQAHLAGRNSAGASQGQKGSPRTSRRKITMISGGCPRDRDHRRDRLNVSPWPRPAPERRLGIHTRLRTPWRRSNRALARLVVDVERALFVISKNVVLPQASYFRGLAGHAGAPRAARDGVLATFKKSIKWKIAEARDRPPSSTRVPAVSRSYGVL